jgi:uncharacterized membrane protein
MVVDENNSWRILMNSFYKTVSWLVVSGILIAGCGYFETGNLKVAVMSAFWACVLKTPIYWIHELFWSRIGAEKIKPVPAEIVCDACEQAIQAQ